MNLSLAGVPPLYDRPPLADGLRSALARNHANAHSRLRDFRRSWCAHDVGSAHQLFLRFRREMVSHLVWEESALLEPFRGRLPELRQVHAISEEIVAHRALRRLLTSVALTLCDRRRADIVRDTGIQLALEELQREMELHGSHIQDDLCFALATVLAEPTRDELASALTARELRIRR